MNDMPPIGPLTKHGPFIRNPQPIGGGFFLVEAQRGTKGTGTVWRPTIVYPNPRYDAGSDHWNTRDPWHECADVHPQQGKYVVAGYVKASIWYVGDDDKRRGVEAYLPDEAEGIAFIVRTAVDFVK